MKYLTTIALLVFVFSAQGQGKVNFGITGFGQVGLATNASKTIKRYFESLPSNKNTENVEPRSIWNTASFTFDIYSKNNKLIFSLGTRVFYIRYSEDSLRKQHFGINSASDHYGKASSSFASLTPQIGMSYRQHIGNDLFLNHTFSLGIFEFMDGYKENVQAYEREYQYLWELDNQAYSDHNYGFNFELSTFDLSLSSSLAYDWRQFTFFLGPSFYFYRNSRTSHYGLYLNGGISVRFLKADEE